jgi:hypothetical protein
MTSPNPSLPGTGSASPAWHMIDEIDLVGLIAEHQGWLRLCDRLERIADTLPAMPPPVETAALRASLAKMVPDGDAVADFPLLQLFAREAAQPIGKRLLTRLQMRRTTLSVEVQDLADMIALDARDRITADTLGYMLRCAFTTGREIIMLERFALLVIAPQRLTAAARALIIERLELGEAAR